MLCLQLLASIVHRRQPWLSLQVGIYTVYIPGTSKDLYLERMSCARSDLVNGWMDRLDRLDGYVWRVITGEWSVSWPGFLQTQANPKHLEPSIKSVYHMVYNMYVSIAFSSLVGMHTRMHAAWCCVLYKSIIIYNYIVYLRMLAVSAIIPVLYFFSTVTAKSYITIIFTPEYMYIQNNNN